MPIKPPFESVTLTPEQVLWLFYRGPFYNYDFVSEVLKSPAGSPNLRNAIHQDAVHFLTVLNLATPENITWLTDTFMKDGLNADTAKQYRSNCPVDRM